MRDSKTIFFVKDKGVGFDMNSSAKLFSVFHRLHDEKEYEGTKIGVGITYRIIHRLGGTIWAESNVDKGAVFYLILGQTQSQGNSY